MYHKPIVLLVSGEYPPYTKWGGNAYQLASLAKLLHRRGYQVEAIAESDNGEEFIHLDDCGNLVHRISASRSYLFKALNQTPLGPRLAFRDLMFAARVAEKALELTYLWNRRILWAETTSWRAETLFFHLLPETNARTIVRIVTPMEEVVEQNGIDRSLLTTRAALFQETLQQFLLKHRLYSNPEYRSFFEERVQTRFPFKERAQERLFLLPFDFDRVTAVPISRRKPPADGVFRLVMVGRIEARKGFDVVCSALAGLAPSERQRIRILAAGRDVPIGPFGSYKQMLIEKFPGIADAQIEYLGALSDSELKRVLREADAGLVASTSESFGYNLVETLAADLPVVTSEVGAANELERRGVRYLGKFKTAAELADIFRELPARFDAYLAAAPHNRQQLEQMYAENDESYLKWVRDEVALPLEFDGRSRPSDRERPDQRIKSADVVVCSYNRFDELMLSLASIVREVESSHHAGLECTATVVYQNENLPAQVYAARPDWRENQRLRFVFSSPPSLTRARNTAIRNTRGELVIFVDDDVVLEPQFVLRHVEAADAHPAAVGVAGRIRSRIEGQRITQKRAVGQIRASGSLDTNFDSVEADSTLVPQTPMGVNMSYRRAVMNNLFGETWFDERFTGSAFREESSLATQIFRHGRHFVYAPNAVLYHFESVTGGCENRGGKRRLRDSIRHYTLDYLFLNRLYEPVGILRALAPLLLLIRDTRSVDRWRWRIEKAYVNASAFLAARRLHAEHSMLQAVAAPEQSSQITDHRRAIA
jgi:glycosyltransferase involved in cell wall biosynthesis/GT2 family glycosyltransferase